MAPPNVIQAVQQALRKAETERDAHANVARQAFSLVVMPGESITAADGLKRLQNVCVAYARVSPRLSALEVATAGIIRHLGECSVDALGLCRSHFGDVAAECPVAVAAALIRPKHAAVKADDVELGPKVPQ